MACEHVGFNYLSTSGIGGNIGTTSLHSARARIGMVVSMSDKNVPCTSREAAQGIGIDTNYGEASGKCEDSSNWAKCGGRLGSGQVHRIRHSPIFMAAEVWIASTAPEGLNYTKRVSAYRAYGSKKGMVEVDDAGGFSTYRIRRHTHFDNPSPELGHVSWNPRYTFAYAIRQLAADKEYRSDLTLTIGAKGYHDQVYTDGLYPVESGE